METQERSILFVDDDEKYRRLVSSIVTDFGYETCQAGSAEEALAVLGGKRFSLMVTDLQMPGLDGVELAARAQRLDPAMEIVLVTGALSAEVLLRARAVGISTVLAKPCRVEELLALVRGEGIAPTGTLPFDTHRVEPRCSLNVL